MNYSPVLFSFVLFLFPSFLVFFFRFRPLDFYSFFFHFVDSFGERTSVRIKLLHSLSSLHTSLGIWPNVDPEWMKSIYGGDKCELVIFSPFIFIIIILVALKFNFRHFFRNFPIFRFFFLYWFVLKNFIVWYLLELELAWYEPTIYHLLFPVSF